jgi:hypothetical protein
VDIFQALVLGIVQGATEFIPISSSGHLVLVPWLLNWPEPGLVFDTIVHWGTLVAVLAVFWRDILALVRAWTRSLVERNLDQMEAHLAWLIIVGTLPAALMGFFLEGFFESLFSSPGRVATLLLVTGAILALSERLGKRQRSLDDLDWLDSLLIGLAQGLAIAPGISRCAGWNERRRLATASSWPRPSSLGPGSCNWLNCSRPAPGELTGYSSSSASWRRPSAAICALSSCWHFFSKASSTFSLLIAGWPESCL